MRRNIVWKALTGFVFALALGSLVTACGEDPKPETLFLQITSDAPLSGETMDAVRFLFAADGVRLPADPRDQRFEAPLLVNPVDKPFQVSVAYGGATFANPKAVTLYVTGLAASKVVAAYEGTVDLTAREIVKVHLKAVASGCDDDGDGFPDCSIPGCCPDSKSVVHDCAPDDPNANPWAYEDPCEPCEDTVDQDCDGEDVACVDEDQDSIPDCAEVACGLGDPTVGPPHYGNPGRPEICDGKDNDCDGETDEGFFIIENGEVLPLGASCGQGACGGGTVVCGAEGAVCSSDGQATEEVCGDGIDNDCDGMTDEGCGAEDVDGDGVSEAAGDCNDFDSAIYPGAPEGCCPAALKATVGEGEVPAQCDKDCSGTVVWCADDDLDGEGFTVAAGDCYDDDPLVYPGAPERCGDGIDQDCFGGDVACSEVVDNDGDGWSPPADCNDDDPNVHPGAVEVCNGVDDDCNGAIDDGNPDTQNSAPCGSDVGECSLGTTVCVNAGGLAGVVQCVGDVRPTVELCDGLDNDCDGETDEPFGPGGEALFTDLDGTTGLVKGDACGVGACAGGTVVCGPGGVTLVCSTAGMASNDVCDGIDNDCDGKVDEDFVTGGTVTLTMPDGTSGLVLGDGCGVGACAGGQVVCGADKASLTCSTLGNVSIDVCDGLDNDCDGKIDEDFVEGGKVTYTDLNGTTGLVKGQSCGVGACAGGQVVCGADQVSLTCSTADAASMDVCDGLDNDCDGETDELFKDGGVVTFNDPSGPSGLVLGAGCGAGVCAGGQVVCGADGVSLACSTGHKVALDVCDGLDNDCDGVVDEDFVDGGTVTYTAPDGATGLVKGDSCGVGACEGGLVVCGADKASLTCSTAGLATTDVCDGIDNDCDGQVDEDYVLGGSVTYTDLDGTTGLVKGQTCGTGACGGGVVVCAANKAALTCSTAHLASADVCDGIDNDCDGQVDEDYVLGGSVTFTDLDGTTGLFKGQSCGVGACAGGEVICGADKASLVCSTGGNASNDVCDGVDNDCDGVTDEDFIEGGTVTYSAPDGATGLVLGQACGSGACAGGEVICGADKASLTCSTGPGAIELCDGIDNDCDGETDEDFKVGGSITYTDLDGTAGLTLGAGCGVGECSGGTVVCGADKASLTCTTRAQAGVDLCDGLDNDCDGETDEDFVDGGLVTYTDLDGTTGLVKGDDCGAGACAGGKVVCGAGGATLTCSTAGNASPDVCDGIDNDCDGKVDEDFVDGGAIRYTELDGSGTRYKGQSCGAGACAGGTVVCGADKVTLVCDTAGNASVDVCDGLDNDCDGEVDEDYVAGGTVKYTELDGSGTRHKGQSCGAGVCAGGTVVCGADKVTLTCSTQGNVSPDLCDGLDNDCDGEVDEDYVAGGSVKYTDLDGTGDLAKGDACGVGACAGGQVVCGADKVTLTCSTAHLASMDVCDGLDNDCDGVADEDYIAGGSVTYTDLNGAGGLAKGASCGVGACAGGEVVCGADKLSLTCSTAHLASMDVCDGVDNDCDGGVDEDYGASGTVRYTQIHDGQGRYKGQTCGVGACAGGQVVCGADKLSLVCTTGGNASAEVCDGSDNDCDGQTDEGLAITDGDKLKLAAAGCKTLGVCGTGTTAACTGGQYVCSYPSGHEVTEISCDNLDNDCDGATDEDLVVSGNLAALAVVGCKTMGACSNLTYTKATCGAGVWTCSYGPDYEAVETRCDGIDNDCDSSTDEALEISGDLFLLGAVGCRTQGVCATAGVAKATCAGGDWACSYSGAGYSPTELCDGLDNDCDGAIDGQVVTGADAGQVGCKQGGVCTGDDVQATCSAGDWSCSYLSPHYEPVETKCDNRDNDCDGTTDGMVLTSLGALAEVGCKVLGVCATPGVTSALCSAGDWQCSYASGDYQANESRCDDKDNDCDGLTDEAFLAGGTVTYTDWNGAPRTKGQGCGTGECAGGTVVCGSATTLACSTAGNASQDVCDDKDNDCDGLTDEAFLAGGTVTYTDWNGTARTKGQGCGTGACGGGTVMCDGPSALTCSSLGMMSEEVCDGVDNDCNGLTDFQDIAIEAGDGLCDGFDNDCDGDTDEDCALCISGGADPAVCGGCVDDDSCGAGYLCIVNAEDAYCAAACTENADCTVAPFGADWVCAQVVASDSDKVCAKTCTEHDDCPWEGWVCAAAASGGGQLVCMPDGE